MKGSDIIALIILIVIAGLLCMTGLIHTNFWLFLSGMGLFAVVVMALDEVV